MSRQLADLLLKDQLITALQHAEGVEAAKGGKSYIRYFLEKKYFSEDKLLSHLSQRFGLPSINISKIEISADAIQRIAPEIAKKRHIIPVKVSQGTLVLAIWDPTVISSIEEIKYLTKMNIEVLLTSVSSFDGALAKYYSGGAAYFGAAFETFKKENKKEGDSSSLELVQIHEIDSGMAAQDAPVIQLVNSILSESIKRMASDIHVEPYEKRFRVRMRIDGNLMEITDIPSEMKRSVVSRLKIMSRMDIAESRVPQDGRIKLKMNNMEVDFRVNSMPTLFGEKLVLRLLSKSNLQLDLKKLGFEQDQLDLFKKGIYSPNGLVLVTGPTGSGKTTTLYSALYDLNHVSENLSTAEDPVEYNLEGINQVQIHKEVGLTFANVLRAFLRQDPDVILVGEIRDYETAEVAIQAALTGHLVLSTLHTNDAPSALTRLINMGVEPFLVVASVNTIVAQRLLRTICEFCRVPEVIPEEKWIELGFNMKEKIPQAFKGTGCLRCNKTGYKGRVAIYEVLYLTGTIKEMLLKGASIAQIKKQAMEDKMKTLRMSAFSKVIEGKTTFEEALSATLEG